ncbi:hypothetical protein N1851_022927 [Merluccius polli]|uniref:Integrase core domain-containing protein n=1 Tax=Merluccius polli TaxID=89951 RepID=A0AA47MH13_MERPO|nr:hypothetical protein N1851_022927 [Merluccius polli]
MIRVHNLLTPIEDNSLDETVTQILQQHPMSGYKMMVGYLNAQGIHIQRQRVQESMRRVDPGGVLMRTLQLNPRRRRKYSVRAPNSLWHIDGNHKLIRYRKNINHLKHPLHCRFYYCKILTTQFSVYPEQLQKPIYNFN